MSGIQFSAQQEGIPDHQKEIIAIQGAVAIVAAAAEAKTIAANSEIYCTMLKDIKKALME